MTPAAAPYRASGLVLWHETDLPTVWRDVCSRGQSGNLVLSLRFSGFDLPAQPVDATHALNLSAGVSNCKVSRGLAGR